MESQESGKKLTVTELSKIFGDTLKFNGKINQYEIRGNIKIVDKMLETDDGLTKGEISFVKQLYRNSNLIKDNLNNNRRMAKTCAFRTYPYDYELFRDYCRLNVKDAIGIALREFCFKEK